MAKVDVRTVALVGILSFASGAYTGFDHSASASESHPTNAVSTTAEQVPPAQGK